MARLICIGLLLTLMAFLPGCGGCRRAPPKTPEEIEKEELERKKEEEERAKPDFEVKFLVSRPPSERPDERLLRQAGPLDLRGAGGCQDQPLRLRRRA